MIVLEGDELYLRNEFEIHNNVKRIKGKAIEHIVVLFGYLASSVVLKEKNYYYL